MPQPAPVRQSLRLLLFTALAALALAACAPTAQLPPLPEGAVDAEGRKQQDLAFREHLARLDQLDRVSWRLRAQSVELCGEHTGLRLGFTLLSHDDVSSKQRDIYARNGVHSRPTVYQLTKGGPAEQAGLRRGDVVAAVNGVQVKKRKEAIAELAKALEAMAAKAAAGPFVPVGVDVERDGLLLELQVTPQRICSYDTYLVNSPQLNAYADGKKIVVYSALMKFLRSDDELAAIVGHEMAHDNQGHIRAKLGNALLGQLLLDLPIAVLTGVNPNLGANLGAQAYSQEFEAEADYVGLYFTARAGYDIENVADIWRRMGVEHPQAITIATTHPSTAQRFVGLEAARDEIKKKRAEGQSLVPEMKKQ